MKILITGGAGFIGYHLARVLLQKSIIEEIYIIDNFSRGVMDEDFSRLLEKEKVHFIQADLKESDALEDVLKMDIDYIFHCAAVCGTRLFYEKPYYTLSNNLKSTMNIIEALKDMSDFKIVFTSTSEAYSGNESLSFPTQELTRLSIADVFNPRWSYAGSKIVGEQLFIHGAKKYDFRYSIIRFHNIYGERMGYEHVVPGVIKRIFEKQDPFEVFGKKETRSFCYVEDAVEALWRVAISDKTDGKIVNIGRSKETEIGDIYKNLFDISGFNPKEILYKTSPKGSTKRRYPDVSFLKSSTGYECKTGLYEGLLKTWDWYKRKLNQ